MKKLLPFFLVVLLPGCVDDNNPGHPRAGDYLVFGHYYGMCAGDRCVSMYLLSETALLEDSNKRYPSTIHPYDGNFSIDRSDKLDEVRELKELPQALINSEDKILGCPDCSDGGGLYIETKLDGHVRYWFIDKQRVPAGLKDFVTLVNDKLLALEP